MTIASSYLLRSRRRTAVKVDAIKPSHPVMYMMAYISGYLDHPYSLRITPKSNQVEQLAIQCHSTRNTSMSATTKDPKDSQSTQQQRTTRPLLPSPTTNLKQSPQRNNTIMSIKPPFSPIHITALINKPLNSTHPSKVWEFCNPLLAYPYHPPQRKQNNPTPHGKKRQARLHRIQAAESAKGKGGEEEG